LTKISSLIHCEGIQRLVNAANSKLAPALEILFVNRRNTPKFRVFPQKEILGLIELEGSTKDIQEAQRFITLAKSTFSAGIDIPLLDYFGTLINFREGLGLIGDELTPKILPDLAKRIREFELEQLPTLFDKSTIDFYIALLLDRLIQMWPTQSEAYRKKEVVKCLQDLGLIEPRLQLSFCTRCLNFEMLIGSQHLGSSKCLKCNRKRICVKVHVFREDIYELKKEDKDLACFVFSYLKRFGVQTRISDWLGPDLEADVYVLNSDTDIECTKTLRESLAIDEEDVKRFAGDLVKKKIENKLNALQSKGIKRVLFITNLSVDDSARLERQITERLKAKDVELKVDVVPRDLKRFIAKLDEEIEIALKGTK